MGIVPAFLFDNDGVLIDSSDIHFQSWVMLSSPDFKMTWENFIKTFGKRNELILKELSPELSEERREELASKKEEIFRDIAKNKVKILDGMEAFLKVLKERNIPRIIASSTPLENLKMLLRETILGKYFDEAVSAEEVREGKPAPDIFIEAAMRLGYSPKDSIVIEDAPAGLLAGKRAGAFVIALETTHRKSELRDYDMIVPSPSDLNLDEILLNWRKNKHG